jgi:hypothetical protein
MVNQKLTLGSDSVDEKQCACIEYMISLRLLLIVVAFDLSILLLHSDYSLRKKNRHIGLPCCLSVHLYISPINF